jgi:hypothetical protein
MKPEIFKRLEVLLADYRDKQTDKSQKEFIARTLFRLFNEFKPSLKGDKGDSIRGDKGDKGDRGMQGIQGKQGKQGIKGDKGDIGIQGLRGIQGEKGDKGNDGSPDTGSDIVKKINDLAITPELQIDAKHIKDLPQAITVLAGGGGNSSISNIVLTKSTDYTVTGSEATGEIVMLCSNTITITLPTAISFGARFITVKNIGAGVITVDGNGSETIDGDLTKAISFQYSSMRLTNNLSNWFIL